MLFLNQRGLSTVELLITLGFLGAVVYGGISVLEKQKSQIIEANQEIQMTTITHELRELLQKRPLCQRSLQGHKPNTTSRTSTKDKREPSPQAIHGSKFIPMNKFKSRQKVRHNSALRATS